MKLDKKQTLYAVLALLLFGYAAFAGWQAWQRRRAVFYGGKLQPPPDVIAFRESIHSPFVPGLDREERRRRWREQGAKIWHQTDIDQKIEIADGYFPEISKRLELAPNQINIARAIYHQSIRQLIAAWDGWDRPGFSNTGPLLQSWLIAGQAQGAMAAHLNPQQREKLQAWMEETQKARQRSETNADSPTTKMTTKSGAS